MAGVEYKTVESSGTGTTLKDAITEALNEAIGRINGLSIETKRELESVEVSVTDNNNEKYYASEKFKNSINTATKGIVSSYDIKKQERDDSGLWEVTLEARIVKYKRAKGSNRKRIAVMPLRLSNRKFLIENTPVNKENTNRILGQSIVSNLVQSRRFTVLDREYIQETLGERKLIIDGATPVSEMARLGQDLVADYILAGTLEDVGFDVNKIKMQTSNRVITSRNGKVEVSYRIIDIDTKQIVFSDFLRLKISESDIRKHDSSIGNKNIESLLCLVAAEEIGNRILNAIYPVLVVSVSDDRVILGQGGSGMKIGDRFDVFEYGKVLLDPYTKESIGREEIYVATIEITRVNPKQSHAKIIKFERDMALTFMPKKFVCRLSQSMVESKTDKKKRRKKEKEERRKSFDDDW